ncbi:hypothetical protein PQQ81_05345 [Paraburkholderia strydomiana]
MYEDYTVACEDLFAAGRKKLTVQQCMLDNKAEAAFQLLDKKAGSGANGAGESVRVSG